MEGRFAIVLAFALLGCGGLAAGEPVEIAYRTDPFTPLCHLSWIDGILVPDAEAGVAILEAGSSGYQAVPVLWPEGFSARRVDGQIEVLNKDGQAIARTGRRYRFHGGTDENGWRGRDGVELR
jgi:hypothetical protein